MPSEDTSLDLENQTDSNRDDVKNLSLLMLRHLKENSNNKQDILRVKVFITNLYNDTIYRNNHYYQSLYDINDTFVKSCLSHMHNKITMLYYN